MNIVVQVSADVHSNSIYREPAEETIFIFAPSAGRRASITAVVEFGEKREIGWYCLSCAAIWRCYNLYNDAPTSLHSACIEMITVDTGGWGGGMQLWLYSLQTKQSWYEDKLTLWSQTFIHVKYKTIIKFNGPCIIMIADKDRPTWCYLFYYFTIYCLTCFEC